MEITLKDIIREVNELATFPEEYIHLKIKYIYLMLLEYANIQGISLWA